MKNGQKSEMRRERKMTFDDFNEDPFDGFSSESFFQNNNINVNDFFRTPERHRAARDRSNFGNGFTTSSSSASSSSSGSNGNNSASDFKNNFNEAKSKMFNNIDKDFDMDFDFPSKSAFTRTSSSNFGNNNSSHKKENMSKPTTSASESESSKTSSRNNEKYSVSFPLGNNIEPEDLNITLKDHQMTVDVKKEVKSGGSTKNQEFRKQFNLPSNVDMKQLTSVLTADGSLKIEAPYIN